MLRGWLTVLAVLGALNLASAAQSASPLLHDKQWAEGRKYLVEGKAADAKVVFDALRRRYPDEPDVYLFLAISLLRLRDPQAAEASVRKAVEIDPNHAEARTLLAWIESDLHGDLDAAIREYTRVVQLKPDFPQAYNNLGVAFK